MQTSSSVCFDSKHFLSLRTRTKKNYVRKNSSLMLGLFTMEDMKLWQNWPTVFLSVSVTGLHVSHSSAWCRCLSWCWILSTWRLSSVTASSVSSSYSLWKVWQKRFAKRSTVSPGRWRCVLDLLGSFVLRKENYGVVSWITYFFGADKKK